VGVTEDTGTTWPALRDAVVRVDHAGFDSLWTWDHMMGIQSSPNAPLDDVHNPPEELGMPRTSRSAGCSFVVRVRARRPFSLSAAGSRAARSPWTSSNSDRETATQRPLSAAAALAQRGAFAPPAPWLPLLLRSSLVHLFAAAVVLLLRHEDSYLRRTEP
jgi:hypothetical protein